MLLRSSSNYLIVLKLNLNNGLKHPGNPDDPSDGEPLPVCTGISTGLSNAVTLESLTCMFLGFRQLVRIIFHNPDTGKF